MTVLELDDAGLTSRLRSYYDKLDVLEQIASDSPGIQGRVFRTLTGWLVRQGSTSSLADGPAAQNDTAACVCAHVSTGQAASAASRYHGDKPLDIATQNNDLRRGPTTRVRPYRALHNHWPRRVR